MSHARFYANDEVTYDETVDDIQYGTVVIDGVTTVVVKFTYDQTDWEIDDSIGTGMVGTSPCYYSYS